MPEGGNHEGAVNSVLAKVDTEAGREVVRAIPPEHVRSAKALVDEALDIVGPNAVVRTLAFQSKLKETRYPSRPTPDPRPPAPQQFPGRERLNRGLQHRGLHHPGQSDPWKRTMSAFKKAGIVVTTPSSGTYVIEAIGNVRLLANLLNEYLEDLPDDAVKHANDRPIIETKDRRDGVEKKSQPASKARRARPADDATEPPPPPPRADDDDDDDASREETEDDAVAEAAGVIGDLTTEVTRRDDEGEGADDADATRKPRESATSAARWLDVEGARRLIRRRQAALGKVRRRAAAARRARRGSPSAAGTRRSPARRVVPPRARRAEVDAAVAAARAGAAVRRRDAELDAAAPVGLALDGTSRRFERTPPRG